MRKQDIEARTASKMHSGEKTPTPDGAEQLQLDAEHIGQGPEVKGNIIVMSPRSPDVNGADAE